VRESQVEDHLVAVAKRCGGVVRKVQWIGRRGAPDRVVFLPNGLLFWIELKRPGKDAEEHQAREHDRLRAFGQFVEVLDTVKKIDDFFAPYFPTLKAK
jgi:hypothetical protein